MSEESNSRPTAAFKYFAGILGKARPKSMAELFEITMYGMEDKVEEADFAYWMYEATDWKVAADKAWKCGNTEWLYVCCVKTATLIYKKVLEHPDLTNELSPSEIDTLQKRSRILLQDVAGLKERLEARYARWEATERVRKQEYRRDILTLHSLLHMEEGRDKPLPAVPDPERSLVNGFATVPFSLATPVAMIIVQWLFGISEACNALTDSLLVKGAVLWWFWYSWS